MKNLMEKLALNKESKEAPKSSMSYNKKLIVSIYSSLQGLEKCVASSQKMFNHGKFYSEDIASSLTEQHKIMKQMRRTANKLQIHLAQENWSEVTRGLDIYYGLRKIVRPEIMQTFQSLATKSKQENFTKPSGQTLH